MEEVKLVLNLSEGLETKVKELYPVPDLIKIKDEPKPQNLKTEEEDKNDENH